MKNISVIVFILFTSTSLNAQDYLISFTGSGESTTIDSVIVQNLTQNTFAYLHGTDTLHLIVNYGIEKPDLDKSGLMLYPNPANESAILQFNSSKQTHCDIDVNTIDGKVIATSAFEIFQGTNSFEIAGLASGIYSVNVRTSEISYACNLISTASQGKKISISSAHHTSNNNFETLTFKNTTNVIDMQYNAGEWILYTGYSGNYTRLVKMIPNQSQTVNFEFIECSDYDGNNYPVVTIGSQIWMASNLKTLHYSDGTSLVDGTNAGVITDDYTTKYWFAYNDTISYKETYGLLYTWIAAMNGAASSASNPSGVQGVCPEGWHLPSYAEWTVLSNVLGGEEQAGGKLKETTTTHWQNPNTDATNISGFTALPGGYRNDINTFYYLGYNGYWWTSTAYGSTLARYCKLDYNDANINNLFCYKSWGFSVRCIKD